MRGQQLDDDQTVLVLLGIVAGPAILAVLASQLPDFTVLLIDTRILAAPETLPVLAIPGTGGAGLDWIRLIPLAAVIVICLVWTVWLITCREDRQGKESRK